MHVDDDDEDASLERWLWLHKKREHSNGHSEYEGTAKNGDHTYTCAGFRSTLSKATKESSANYISCGSTRVLHAPGNGINIVSLLDQFPKLTIA